MGLSKVLKPATANAPPVARSMSAPARSNQGLLLGMSLFESDGGSADKRCPGFGALE